MEIDTQVALLDPESDPHIIEDETTSAHDLSFESISSDHDYHLKNIEDNNDQTESPIDPSTVDTLLVRQVEQPNFKKTYKLRPCSVLIEPCDKIWATLQLIKNLQEDNDSVRIDENQNDSDMACNDDSNSEQGSTIHGEEPNLSNQANPTIPYIQYQPVLGNGNTALPNFLFSVKSTRPLYHCYTCGRQYSHRKTLRDHSERVHNIIIPLMRTKSENSIVNGNKKVDAKTQDITASYNDEESNAELSEDPPEPSEALLDDSSDTTETSSKSSNSKQKNPLVCTHCDRSYSDKYSLRVHLEAYHDVVGLIKHRNGIPKNIRNARPAMKMFRCRTCGKHFHLAERLKEHTRKIHGYTARIHNQQNLRSRRRQAMQINEKSRVVLKTNDESVVSNGKEKKILYCPVCKKPYIDRVSWKLHCKKIHGVMIPKGRYDKERFENHIKTSIKLKKRTRQVIVNQGKGRWGFECTECGQRFRKERYYDSHMLKHDLGQIRTSNELEGEGMSLDGRPISLALARGDWGVCDLCHKTICWKRNMKSHRIRCEKLHREKKSLECYVCKAQYIYRFNLLRHLKLTHGISKVLTEDPPEEKHIESVSTVRSLRTRERVNYDEKTHRNSSSSNLNDSNIPLVVRQTEFKKIPPSSAPAKIQPVKPPEPTQSIPSTPLSETLQCILCGRHCKKIHRHFIDYHKIPHPEALISQCKPSTVTEINSQTDENKKQVSPQKQQHTNSTIKSPVAIIKRNSKANRRHLTRPSYYVVPGPDRPFELITDETNQKVYKCKSCPYTAYNYQTSRSHQRVAHPIQFPVVTPQRMKKQRIINQRIKQQRMKPQRRNRSLANLDELRRRSLIQSSRTTRATLRMKEEIDFECLNCHRTFRNAEVHASHKISCNQRMSLDPTRLEAARIEAAKIETMKVEQTRIETVNTRESSDRDSGIGISITIKKKNNSYEVVSRDSSGERKSQSSNQGDSNKDDTTSSDASSDLSSVIRKNFNWPQSSAQYSRDHQVLKIQKSDDDDVEIDLISDDPIPVNTPENNEESKVFQVCSLVELCKKIIAESSKKKLERFQCPECFVKWDCSRALAVHRRIHNRPAGNRTSL